MSNLREFRGPDEQGIDEEITYWFSTSPWNPDGLTPSAASCKVYTVNQTTGALTDVTATVMPTNSPTISGMLITLSPLKALTVDNRYRVEVKFTIGGNVLEAYKYLDATQ